MSSQGVENIDDEFAAALADYQAASTCLNEYIETTLYNSMTADDPVDVGFSAGLADATPRPTCPAVFEATTPIEHIVEWSFIDYEHAAPTSSFYSYPDDFDGIGNSLPAVTGGYENLPIRYAEELFDSGSLDIDFDTKVTMIDYENDDGDTYKVMTTVTRSDDSCTFYRSKYIILTVSTGVLQSDSIDFIPTLDYPVSTNPYDFEVYQRVFFKFTAPVGVNYNRHLLITYDEEEGYNEAGHHWENMRVAGKGDGEYWYCTIVTEALEELSPNGAALTATQLDTILDRLRLAFPEDEDKMTMGTYQTFVPDLVNRESFGFGSYGTLRPGTTLTDDFYPFFGGGILPQYCKHNGCDSNGNWRLHISGSASCYEHYELVDGALYSGERSANYVLFDMGEIEEYTTAQLTLCDDINFLADIFANEGGGDVGDEVDDEDDNLCEGIFILLLPFCLLVELALTLFGGLTG